MGLRQTLTSYCEASDCVWITARKSIRDKLTRRALVPLLHASAVLGILPPPPGRGRLLCAVLYLLASFTASLYSITVLVLKLDQYSHIKSIVSRYAFIGSSAVSYLQPVVVVGNCVFNYDHVSAALAGLLRPPCALRWPMPALSALMLILTYGKHVVFVAVDSGNMHSNVVQALGTVVTFLTETLVILLCSIAEGKFHVLNRDLKRQLTASLPGPARRPLPHAVHRALALERASRRYEEAVDAVAALCHRRALGLPLLLSQVRLRLKTVTDSYSMVHALAEGNLGSFAAYVVTVTSLGLRIVSLATAGDALHRASRATEGVICSFRTKGWREVEKELSSRLLRSSRRGARLTDGGVAGLEYAFMLSVFGSALNYLIVLLQQ